MQAAIYFSEHDVSVIWKVNILGLLLVACLPLLQGEEISFERDVRPILSENCFHCHGPDAKARKADLRLDTYEGIIADLGGYAAVVPGDPDKSELIIRIAHSDSDELMPPVDSNRSLKPREIEILTRWIKDGALWAKHWAFVLPQKPELPKTSHPVDHFVRARLAKEKLAPSPAADRRTILRRLTLDLTGLPPTPAEIDAFLKDESADAYEKVVDRLLASKRYGERMAWDWLDAARYADTDGYQQDPTRTMWPWRDWVIRAFNDNMPFDRFTIEQLAGDLLPNPTKEQRIATAFNRNHMHNGEGGRIPEETRVENVFDRVETTSTVWLGLTMACTRCHDHKYDPLTLRDYFGMFDIFNQTSERGARGKGKTIKPYLELTTQEEHDHLAEVIRKFNALADEVSAFERKKFSRKKGKPLPKEAVAGLPFSLRKTLGKIKPAKRMPFQIREIIRKFKKSDPEYTKLNERLLAALEKRRKTEVLGTRVMVMDTSPKARDTYILAGGSYRNRTDTKVYGSIPTVLAPAPVDPDRRLNRLDFARWIVSRENPLTARVTVNRSWQLFFGRGLVKTSEDFGVQSSPPSHPELLDWLAVEFMDSGWDMKALHKIIVMSQTYRQQSRHTETLRERDPENILLARGPRSRMPSWMLRDQALSVGGLLVNHLGGPGVKPYQPDGVWADATFGKKKYIQDQGDALYRRSIYTFWRRIVGPTMFFDVSNRNVCSVKPSLTNTPLNALTLLNETTYVEAARALAQRVLSVEGAKTPADRIDQAYHFTLGRPATAAEKNILTERLDHLRNDFTAHPDAAEVFLSVGDSIRAPDIDPIEHASYAALCTLLLNLDETLTRQ